MNLNLTRSVIATSLLIATSAAQATPIVSASLYLPQIISGSAVSVAVNNPGSATPSQTPIAGSGYAISFATNASEGLVQGNLASLAAVPVAGVTASGAVTYLTGDYGSAQTTSMAASGKYLSTGVGSITIAFTAVENAFSLLWGSIDVTNDLKFYQAGALQADVTGALAQAAAAGFVSNGYQGAGGSAYVVINNVSFDTVVASSSTPSFEFTGAVASTGAISVPEPSWLAGFSLSLLSLALLRRVQCVQFSARPKRKLSA